MLLSILMSDWHSHFKRGERGLCSVMKHRIMKQTAGRRKQSCVWGVPSPAPFLSNFAGGSPIVTAVANVSLLAVPETLECLLEKEDLFSRSMFPSLNVVIRPSHGTIETSVPQKRNFRTDSLGMPLARSETQNGITREDDMVPILPICSENGKTSAAFVIDPRLDNQKPIGDWLSYVEKLFDSPNSCLNKRDRKDASISLPNDYNQTCDEECPWSWFNVFEPRPFRIGTTNQGFSSEDWATCDPTQEQAHASSCFNGP